MFQNAGALGITVNTQVKRNFQMMDHRSFMQCTLNGCVKASIR